MLKNEIILPDFGLVKTDSSMYEIEKTSNNAFNVGKEGVEHILITPDKKVELIGFKDKTLAYLPAAAKYSAYYPIYSVSTDEPVKAVLMDLDGTSVKSEEFWMWLIEKTLRIATKNPHFEFEEADLPFIAGHSITEHLSYCIEKYCHDWKLEDLRKLYYEHTHYEMNEIMQGRGHTDAFKPSEGLKEFLYYLKGKGVKIGLVTSGLYEKAMPEIISAFKTLDMGDPLDFYDAIISGGYAMGKGRVGTLGELAPKPHPWLYTETSFAGLGITYEERNSVLAFEDSGAGACSARLAGFATVGVAGGNIISSGTKDFCSYFVDKLNDICKIIDSRG